MDGIVDVGLPVEWGVESVESSEMLCEVVFSVAPGNEVLAEKSIIESIESFDAANPRPVVFYHISLSKCLFFPMLYFWILSEICSHRLQFLTRKLQSHHLDLFIYSMLPVLSFSRNLP